MSRSHDVAVTGRGPPLVLVHGWGLNRHVFAELAVRLAHQWTVHAVNLPGHGGRALGESDSGAPLDYLTDSVASLVPENAVWCGWSLGGLVAMNAARRHRVKVKALVLIATTPRFTRTTGWGYAMTSKALSQFGERLAGDYAAGVEEFLALQAREPGQMQGVVKAVLKRPASPEGLAFGQRALAESDLRAVLPVDIPALLVAGTRDALVPPRAVPALRAHWPGLRAHVVDGAAHAPFLSHAEEFHHALDTFLGGQMTTTPSNIKLPTETLTSLYHTMRRVRAFDERVATLFESGEVRGTAHSYVGEEAVAAAVCAQLTERDYVASNHRGHGHCIAKGARMELMMAELMGRDSGYCRGLGGSMHIADLGLNILGANGIVGAAMPLSCGAGLAARLRGEDQVVVAFFGDGASNQGIFHESMNLAAVWKLPVIFVCENNQYALTTSFRTTTAVEQVAQRAVAYGMPGVTVDGNDVAEVHHVVGDAIARARAGEGPSLIEAMTYRWGQHSMRANLHDPRPEPEYAEWMAKDPVARVESTLRAADDFEDESLVTINAAVAEEIESAVAFAREGEQPSADLLNAAVYAPHAAYPPAPPPGERELDFTQALNEALDQEMARDPSVFLMGEDVGTTGGIFQVSRGLKDRYGEERVRDTPISEATFVGCGAGAAIAGMRPVVEIQIFDFIALTMDMLVNQAAKFRFMLGGKNTVPLVVRGPQGGGIGMAAQHSQSLEAWFTHVPGLVVVAPSSPYDAKGLLVSAIRDDNPVIFLETKLLYVTSKGPVPESLYALPLGQADIKREGTDVTVVATMAMVPRALAAAEQLANQGISVEVIDPRTLRPLDEESILSSVRKTSRLVIVHEAWTTGGFGAEVSALVADKAFMDLDAPIARVGALDVPMPYNDALERATIPSQARIVDAILKTVRF